MPRELFRRQDRGNACLRHFKTDQRLALRIGRNVRQLRQGKKLDPLKCLKSRQGREEQRASPRCCDLTVTIGIAAWKSASATALRSPRRSLCRA